MPRECHDKKIHVHLSNEVLVEFKKRLLDYDATLQVALEEFMWQVARGQSGALAILDRLARVNLEQRLTELGPARKKFQKLGKIQIEQHLGKIDSDTVYDLIASGDNKTKTRKLRHVSDDTEIVDSDAIDESMLWDGSEEGGGGGVAESAPVVTRATDGDWVEDDK